MKDSEEDRYPDMEIMEGAVFAENGISDLLTLLDSRAQLAGNRIDPESVVAFLEEQEWICGAALIALPDNTLLAASGIPEEMLLLFRNELPAILDGDRGINCEHSAGFLVESEKKSLFFLPVRRKERILGFVLLLTRGYRKDDPGLNRMFVVISDFFSGLDIPLLSDLGWMQSVIDNLPGIVFQYYFRNDTDHGLRYISAQVEDVIGYSAAWLMETQNLFSLVSDSRIREFLLNRLEQSGRSPTPWNRDIEIVDANNAIRYLHVEANPQVIGEGVVVWTGFVLDISEEKRLRDLQEVSAEKYKHLVNSSPEAIFLLSGYKFIFVNRQAVHLLGFESEEELLGQDYSVFFTDHEQNRVHILQRNLIDGKIDILPPVKTDLIARNRQRIPVEIRTTAFNLMGRRTVQCVVRDIARERNLLIALEESEHLYRTLFEKMTTAFALHEIILDGSGAPVDYRYLEVNSSFEKETGLKKSQVIHKTVKQVIPDIKPFWIDRYGQVALTRESIHFVEYDERTEKAFDITAFSPAPGQFATIFSDVTFLKRAEMQIRLERDRAQSFLRNAGTAFLALDENGTIKMVNPRLCEIIGRDEHDLIGSDWFANLSPEDRERQYKAFQRRVGLDEVIDDWIEYPVMSASGDSRIMYWRFDRIDDPDSRDILYLLSGEDVTDRRHYEQYLNMYLKIVSASKEQLAFFDLDWIVRAQNDAMLFFLGKSREDVLDHHISELFSFTTFRDTLQPALEKAFNGAEVILEDWGLFPRYEDRYYRVTLNPYFGTTGVIGVVYSQQDLTNQVRLEREILDAGHNERRQIGMELHDNLSHGLLDLAIRSKVLSNSLMHEYPSLSRDADAISTGLTRAIETTRNLAHGLFPLNLEQGSLLTMFKGIMKSIHKDDGIAIDFQVALEEDLVDRAVATQLFFIGREAIVNAIKHSGARNIILNLNKLGSLGVLSVSDDGQGLHRSGTSGIGVNIMKYRARVIGGTITVEENLEGGVAVKCLFPMEQKVDN